MTHILPCRLCREPPLLNDTVFSMGSVRLYLIPLGAEAMLNVDIRHHEILSSRNGLTGTPWTQSTIPRRLSHLRFQSGLQLRASLDGAMYETGFTGLTRWIVRRGEWLRPVENVVLSIDAGPQNPERMWASNAHAPFARNLVHRVNLVSSHRDCPAGSELAGKAWTLMRSSRLQPSTNPFRVPAAIQHGIYRDGTPLHTVVDGEGKPPCRHHVHIVINRRMDATIDFKGGDVSRD